MKYIITGIGSGLGKYLHKNIPNSVGMDRNNQHIVMTQIEPTDKIIHCAFNKTNDIKDYNGYLEDNIFLTQRLSELGNKLIYISSIDVYLQENLYSFF